MLKSDFLLRPSAFRRLAFIMPLAAAYAAAMALPYPVRTQLLDIGDSAIVAVAIVLLAVLLGFPRRLFKKCRLCASYFSASESCRFGSASEIYSQPGTLRIEFDGEWWCEHLSGGVVRKRLDRARSRLLPFAVFLVFTDSQNGRSHRWLLADECDALYYRRLARAVKG